MSVTGGNLTSIGTGGAFTEASADVTPPSPPPDGTIAVDTDTVTITQTSDPEAGATRKLERRLAGSVDAWDIVATDATPAEGRTLVDSGVDDGVYDYQLADYDADGNRTIRGRLFPGICIGSGPEFQDDLDVDLEDVFLSGDMFSETVTYRFESGGTKSLVVVFAEIVGAFDAYEQATVYVRADPVEGVLVPRAGEQVQRIGGDRWTVADVRSDLRMHELRCIRPVDRT